MTEQVRFIQNQNITLYSEAGSSLHEGDSVYVKVLNSLGNNKYLVSILGKKVEISSELKLEKNQNLLVQINSLENGKIVLKSISTAVKEVDENFNQFLSQKFFDLNLPFTEASVKLMQFIQQSKSKLERKNFERALSMAKSFPDKEKEAAEIAYSLLEKGINPTEENIRKLLHLTAPHTRHSKYFDRLSTSFISESVPAPASSIESALTKLLPDFLQNKEGLLTLCNHIKSEDGNHWLVLPFEWKLEEKNLNGIIRLLLNTQNHCTEKICVTCKSDFTNYFFVLYLNSSKAKEVRFWTLPPLLTSEIQSEEKRIGELLRSGMNSDSVTVSYSTLALTEGLYSSHEQPFVFEEII